MKKKILLVPALFLLAATVLPSTLMAYRGDPSVQGPNCTPERHTAMTQAFEKLDYEAWKALMPEKSRAAKVITKENFARFSEMRRLMLEGKKDEASVIRAELGLGQGRMNNR